MIGLHVTITSLSHPLRMWPFPLFLWGSGLSLPLHLCPSSLSPTAFFIVVAYSASVVVITPLAIIALVSLLEPGLDNHTIIPLLTLFFLAGYVTPFILAGFFPEFNKSTKYKDEVKTAASKSLKAAQEHKCDPCTIASLGATTDLQVTALRNAVGNIDRRAEKTGWWKWIFGKLFYLVLIVVAAAAASAVFAR
jgi:ABC-type multidrug transport system fused ATPase/permease subunit